MNFNIERLQNADTTYIDRLLIDETGLIRCVPADVLRDIKLNDLKVWCVKNAIYIIPTRELIDWLSQMIDGRRAIEICAGKSCLGRHLNIPMTDSYMQASAEMMLYYSSLGQAPIIPPSDVEMIDANDAVIKYQPEVVIGGFVTYRFVGSLTDGGNALGPDEALILRDADYIMVGNLATHGRKPLLACPHEVYEFPWLYGRQLKPELARIWVWKRQNFPYPWPKIPLCLGIPPADVPNPSYVERHCEWCPATIAISEIHVQMLKELKSIVVLCHRCLTAAYGPEFAQQLSAE